MTIKTTTAALSTAALLALSAPMAQAAQLTFPLNGSTFDAITRTVDGVTMTMDWGGDVFSHSSWGLDFTMSADGGTGTLTFDTDVKLVSFQKSFGAGTGSWTITADAGSSTAAFTGSGGTFPNDLVLTEGETATMSVTSNTTDYYVSSITVETLDVPPVPVPASGVLLGGLMLAGAAAARRKRG